jgi:capsule biosynthesis phosphatase
VKIVVDLDGTITRPKEGQDSRNSDYDEELVEVLRRYRREGFTIAIYTSRNMRTFSGNLGKINAVTLPAIIDWLARNDIPFDEVHVGKPWCEAEGFYVDDRAIRPDEFKRLSLSEVYQLLGMEAPVIR